MRVSPSFLEDRGRRVLNRPGPYLRGFELSASLGWGQTCTGNGGFCRVLEFEGAGARSESLALCRNNDCRFGNSEFN